MSPTCTSVRRRRTWWPGSGPTDRLFRPLGAYRRFVSPEAEPAVRDGGLHLLGLSSPRPYLWKGGRIGAGQVARIGAEFNGPGDLKVLMLHHPVFRSTPRPDEKLVYGVEPALHAAGAAGVDVVLCGHDHVSAQAELSAGGRQMIGLMSGTACSWRVRAGESQAYTVLELTGDRLRLTVRSWRADGSGFGDLGVTDWHRSPDGWRRRGPGPRLIIMEAREWGGA